MKFVTQILLKYNLTNVEIAKPKNAEVELNT